MASIAPARPTARIRFGTLALAIAVALGALVASPAAATDAPPRSPAAPTAPGSTAPLSAADAAQAEQAETARVVLTDTPELTPATTASVTGTLVVRDVNGDGPFPAQSGSSWIRFWLLDTATDTWNWVRDVDQFGANGEFTASGFVQGQYRVEFVSYDGAPVREYWDNEPLWFASDILILSAFTSVGLGTVTLEPAPIDFFRIAGDDRYATAVAISQSVIGPGESAPVVYIATGASFADALSAGPAAAERNGVLLLTAPTALPPVVQTELARLDPAEIIVVGGASVVSDGVQAALSAYVASPTDVRRIAGADRYATSRAIVADAFGAGVPDLFIATGRDFPDALAAGPAASRLGGAVLLVDGAAAATDVATRTLITALGTPDLHIAGGLGAVSAGVQASLAAHVGGAATITRYAGDSRYDTALDLNAAVFGPGGADFAFLATGAGFADALAGGPLAAASDAPLYLSTQVCLRDDEYIDMILLLVKEVYALGGTGVLSDRVLSGTTC
ncbi:cell wall-binding repeat-containing protein [Microcella sp.]|uniref:cell wall-binding repeat-containing protein n=1 Tax=Microcella sp. TaxID=1913979 RepID=UPI003F724EFB